jgi:hypothetical protein
MVLAACGTVPEAADPASDAPEAGRAAPAPYKSAASYAEALQVWRTPEDVNAWIGARFEYDMPRAMQLSESQRARTRLPIHAPSEFFLAPRGVCVDLARFGVETLRAIDPAARPAYLMIEFDPVAIAGNTLRRHWVAVYRTERGLYVFADSKRPGHLAGPYASPAQFIEEYARSRGRRIVAYRELETFERQLRTRAIRKEGTTAPDDGAAEKKSRQKP